MMPVSEPSVPSPTPPTGNGGSIAVALDLLAIDYVFSESATMPVRDDFLALEGVTADFFEQYMQDVFEDSTQTTLLEFQTFLVTSILT